MCQRQLIRYTVPQFIRFRQRHIRKLPSCPAFRVELTLFQSPQGKLHQIDYALEAVKQGSAAIGLRSKTHAVLLTLKVGLNVSLGIPSLPLRKVTISLR